jgi:phosphatidate cytidylyltransferase
LTETTSERSARPGRGGILIRIGSAAVLLAVIVGGIASGLPGAALVIGALTLIGTAEFYLISRSMGRPAAPWVLFPLTVVLLFRFQLSHLSTLVVPAAVTLAVIVGLGAFLWFREQVDGMSRWAMAVAGSLYLGWMLGFYFAFYTARDPDPGRIGFGWLVALAGSSMLGDTAALVIGTRFGRHRFFPAISPKKSVEGAVAGFVVQTLFFALMAPVIEVPGIHGLILGGLIAVASQAGDLIESQFKRAAGMKDASTWVPGHGGMLDRMDSLILLPGVAYYYMALVLHASLPQ